MKTETTAILIILAAALIGGAVMFSGGKGSSGNATTDPVNNVSIVDGKQIITIKAKGGYYPKVTTAKAGLPTVIKMETQGTFDCSSAISIPSLNYRTNLPASGETSIPVPAQQAGTNMRGLCAMGMYNFQVRFN